MKLTDRQQEVLDFIESSRKRLGFVPSSREIQQHFGFASQTAAMNHLRALERRGAIRRQPGKARAVSLLTKPRRKPAPPRASIIDIPVFGSIAAGLAEMNGQQPVEVVSVNAETIGLRKGRRVFALKVRGDSMIGAGISDGDLVVLEHRAPQSGAIVAALIDGETTLKRYVISHGRPHLQAENPAYPNLTPVQDLAIQGVMVALIRKFRS